jgi:hypothetical protein
MAIITAALKDRKEYISFFEIFGNIDTVELVRVLWHRLLSFSELYQDRGYHRKLDLNMFACYIDKSRPYVLD